MIIARNSVLLYDQELRYRSLILEACTGIRPHAIHRRI